MDESSASPPAPPATSLTPAQILRPALRLWLLVMLIYGAGDLVTMLLTRNFMADSQQYAMTYALPMIIAQIVVLAITLKAVWPEPDARCVFRKPPRRAVEICVVTGIVSWLAFKMWYEWLTFTSDAVSLSVPIEDWELVWIIIQFCVIAPLWEEWAFRGLMLHRFRKVMGDPMAVATQAMMFSALHMDSRELISHFLFGVVAGVLRIQARALWPCMLVHALWNGAWVMHMAA